MKIEKNRIETMFLFIMLFSIFFTSYLYGQEYEIKQLTNNDYDDRIPKIDNGQIVWWLLGTSYLGTVEKLLLFLASFLVGNSFFMV